ncbi:MAG: D-alanyl-D-alanine carboxypeptidase family protein [Dehalococcoidia bacterium]
MFAALCLLVVGVAPVIAAPTTPSPPEPCANRQKPPPPVDSSEVPAPGEPVPTPLPVPPTPIGGQRMGECRVVLPSGAPRLPRKITAASWVLSDVETGEVLAAKDPHGRQRPASLIKVLLALVVIDELAPAHIVTATKEDASQECTCIGIVKGERYTVEELLTGVLIRSGNDVAHALGTALGGIPAALAKMNGLAEKIGALDTRAATTSGLDGPGMSTSAYDMSLIFSHALRQPRFTKAVTTERMNFVTKKGKAPITLYNDNRLLREYSGFLGGKTGFTDDSRHTYVGAAERDGRRLAVVLLRAEQRPIRVSDQAARMLDYGFRLAELGTEPVGELVAPAGQEVVGDAAEDNGTTGGNSGGSGGSGPALALVIAGAALIGIIALRRGGKRKPAE